LHPFLVGKMREKIIKTIQEHHLIHPGDRVLLALSGGEDSSALLDVLAKLQSGLSFTLLACHVHHGIRGASADEDASFSEKLAKRYEVPFFLKKVEALIYQKEKGLSLEEAARDLRYQVLQQVAGEQNCQKIVLAHHQQDQVETVLFHWMRGSGLRGLSGMEYERNRLFIRPMLDCSKEEIHAYVQDNCLDFVCDETNLSEDYSRNAIRHCVLPKLEEIRPHSMEKIATSAAYLREVDDYLRAEALDFLKKEENPTAIKQLDFVSFPQIKKEYIIRLFLEKNQVPLKDLGRIHLQQIVDLFSAEVGKSWIHKSGFRVEKTYEGIQLREIQDCPQQFIPDDIGKLHIRQFPYEEGLKIPEKEYTKWVDCDKINGSVSLRTKRSGDVFSTSPGTHQKLKDFMINEKIPQAVRNQIPLVSDESEVIWVVGHRLNENYKIGKETKTVLEINYSEE